MRLLDPLRALRDRLFAGPRILLYHRVAALGSDPQWLAVDPARFERQMEILARETRVVSLAQMSALARSGRLPPRAVAITFDDGYADNLLAAEPILRRHGLPATVFACAAATAQERELYWDELDRLLLQGHALPRRLSVTAGGALHAFDLGGDAAPCTPDAAWNATRPPATARQRCYLALCAALRPLDHPGRQLALEELRLQVGLPLQVRPTHRLLDAAGLRRLAASEHVSIGAHTFTHAMLSRLPAARQEEEIAGSRAELERIIGRPVTAFAYPFGGRDAFDATSQALVRKAGFEVVCENVPGPVRPRADPLALPRELVRDWGESAFRERLKAWLDA